MTVRLLTLASLAWASSAMAQNWEEPKLPSVDNLAVPIENEGHYYATPVGSGQFLCGSNAWGTQASLSTSGYEVVLYQGLEIGDGGNEETWSIAFPIIPGNPAYAGDFLFIDNSVANIFCNAYNGSGNTNLGGRSQIHFTFVPNNDGTNTYRITHGLADEDNYMGWDGTTMGESGVPRLSFMSATEYDPETDEEVATSGLINWAFIPVDGLEGFNDAYALYEAQVELYNLLNEAEMKDVTLDDIVAIYNNEQSTIDDITAATKTLRERILADIPDGEEADVTSMYIKNADCTANEGWETNFNTQSSTYGGPDDALISGRFFEKWTWDAQLSGTYHLTQELNLPAGKYRLEASVIAVRQSEQEAPIYGVTLFADGGQAGFQAVSDPISTPNNTPNKVAIEFDCVNPVTIGLKIENTNANWVAVDNFQLFLLHKYTDADMTKVTLDAKVGVISAYLYIDEDTEMPANTISLDSRAAANAFIEKCQNNTDLSEETLNALIAEADAVYASLQAEVEAYKGLVDLLSRLETDQDVYAEYGILAETIGNLYDTVTDQLAEPTWSTAQVEETVNGYDDMIAEGVRTFIATEAKPGTDISVLIKNRDMDEGNKWTNSNEQPQIPGWNAESTSPWGYDQSAGEFWNMDFDFYQDIEGLPAGKYTVSFQGFYRWGNPGEVVDAYNPEVPDTRLIAVLYGNEVETTFKSICDGRFVFAEGENPGGFVDCGTDDEGNTYKMPNSMSAAQYAFTNHPEGYYTEATAIVGEDGHLRIGIRGIDPAKTGNRWVIFDTFRLRYDGNDASMYFDELARQADALAVKRNSLVAEHSLPQDLYDEVTAMKTRALEMAADAATTTDQCVAFLADIKTMSAKLDAVSLKVKALIDDYLYYDNAKLDGLLPEHLLTDRFNSIFDAVANVVNESGFNESCLWATTADLDAMAHDINANFVLDVFSGAGSTTTEAAPYEMTSVIRNAHVWQDDDITSSNGEISCWSGSGVTQHQVGIGEVWNNNYDIAQTIISLPAGYYRLTVDGCYRYGNAEEAVEAFIAGTEDLAAELYAQQNDKVWGAPLMSVCTDATNELADDYPEYEDTDGTPVQDHVVTIDGSDGNAYYLPYSMTAARAFMDEGRYKDNKVTFYSDGGNVQIGLRKTRLREGDSSIFDNFQLYYLGTEAPTGYQDGVETKVVSVGTAAGAKLQYYTIGGVQISQPQRGVTIVVSTLPDGTQTKTKVVMK